MTIIITMKNGRRSRYEWDRHGVIYRLQLCLVGSYRDAKIGSAKTVEQAIAIAKLDAQARFGSPVRRVDVT